MLSTSRLTLVYAGFAVVVAVFVWTYLGWLILLAGAQLSFYLQNPQNLRLGHQLLRLSGTEQERLALDIMARVAQRHHCGRATRQHRFTVSAGSVLPGSPSATWPSTWSAPACWPSPMMAGCFPARDIASIHVQQIIDSARSRSSGHQPQPRSSIPGVQHLQEKLERPGARPAANGRWWT